MQIEVLSVGGSVIAPDTIDVKFLEKLKKLITSFHDRKFVIVAGGGKIARLYIEALRKDNLSKRVLSNAGIAITRINATFLAEFFTKKPQYPPPTTLKEIKNLLKKHSIVFCGSLRYEDNNTSDGTAAEIARHFRTRFINITNVKGLYTKDPKRFKDAQFIPRMSFDDFERMAKKISYAPGQHFVLDQHASSVIKKGNIPTYIIGKDMNNLAAVLKGKKWTGTLIAH